ncbi:hydrolase [Ktedonospora formicarum]|uniref:Hydrolase n=1 Tax=Ktedonospora formicarum TaxID=2778364 RepID=A0A8J3I1I1_9CHLR|nr:hydrolase [Ktedonospora formicarum]GHO47046.1 hydrolase [Ktedonospora formicarum]
MTSLPIRDPMQDHLLTPKNAALVLIDYQPLQIYTVKSMNSGDLINNVVTLARLAKVFELPIVLTTVNVKTGVNPDTIPQLKEALSGVKSYDRTSINTWEDKETVAAIKATGRRKLIIGALWTEACLLFPTLDALKEGYEVYPVVDALGGTTSMAHETALRRIEQAGAHLVTWNAVACELQRDWARKETVKGFLQTVIDQNTDWGWFEELRGAGKRSAAPVAAGARSR